MKKFITIIFCLIFTIQNFSQSIEQKVFIQALKENSKRYFYVPFEVPVNTKSVTIAYNYDKKNGNNTLDLGIFDAGFDETEKTLHGFRGWSGGRRNEIFITEKTATNGYLAGNLPQGKWRIIFGLYKVATEGVEVTIKIKFNDVDSALLKQPREENSKNFILPALEKMPAADKFNGFTWYRGDLHLHTFHSDGSWTFPMIFDRAKSVGLDFVGLTDHNTMSHHAEINRLSSKYPNLLILRGEEVTTYGGHFNVWGLPTNEIIDFRVTPKNETALLPSIDKVHQFGLIASINHPTALCGGCDWTYGDWTKMDSVEIWNGFWDFTDELALKKWDELLQRGKQIAVIGSSDSHTPPINQNIAKTNPDLGEPTNHVGLKNLTQSELISAIKKGRTWISNTPKNYQLRFSILANGKKLNIGDESEISDSLNVSLGIRNFPIGATMLLISNGQTIHSDKIILDNYTFEKSIKINTDSYFRIEIRDSANKMLALTNPIFLRKIK